MVKLNGAPVVACAMVIVLLFLIFASVSGVLHAITGCQTSAVRTSRPISRFMIFRLLGYVSDGEIQSPVIVAYTFLQTAGRISCIPESIALLWTSSLHEPCTDPVAPLFQTPDAIKRHRQQ